MGYTTLFRNIMFGFSFHGSKPVKASERKDKRDFLSTVHQEIERRRGIVSTSTIENELTAYGRQRIWQKNGHWERKR